MFVLGIDWGGTFIKIGLVKISGKVNLLKKLVYASERLKEKETFISKLISLIEEFKDYKIKGIGIGAPGIIDTRKGFIYYLPNVKGWENFPLKEMLEGRLKIPVFVDNDANLFALGEAKLGVGKEKKRIIFLTLGTGLGSSIIWEGKILEAGTSSLELAHVPVSLKGRKCGCGARGCIETFIGAKYLLRRYYQLKKERIKEVRELFQRGLKKEKEALIVWREFSYSLGKFLAGMVNIFNPQMIIIGGGVSGAFRLFKPLLLETIKKEAMWPQLKNLKLVRAKLKNAAIFGAAIMVKERLKVE
ncbi:MAG TPA: ROK family protein [Candidatus Omnitrophica bacterium]|nr:ROK family protein [Candidatus Omnitrophota bacterium]